MGSFLVTDSLELFSSSPPSIYWSVFILFVTLLCSLFINSSFFFCSLFAVDAAMTCVYLFSIIVFTHLASRKIILEIGQTYPSIYKDIQTTFKEIVCCESPNWNHHHFSLEPPVLLQFLLFLQVTSQNVICSLYSAVFFSLSLLLSIFSDNFE